MTLFADERTIGLIFPSPMPWRTSHIGTGGAGGSSTIMISLVGLRTDSYLSGIVDDAFL